MSEVFQLGTHVVWVTPSGAALLVDPAEGREQMSDAEIDRLFAPGPK
jgi:Ca-activated chloride channel family protein